MLIGEGLTRFRLAASLEGAVVLAGDVLGGKHRGLVLRGDLADRGRLISVGYGGIGVGRYGGCIEVVVGRLGEKARGFRHPAWDRSGVIDHRIPATARRDLSFECGDIVVTVALELLEIRKEIGIRLAPIEKGDLVASGDRVLDHRRSDESGAAEDKDLEFLGGGFRGRGLGLFAAGEADAGDTAGEDRKLDKVSA